MGRKKRKTSTDAAGSESAEPVTDGAVDTSLTTVGTNTATSSSPPPTTSTNSTVKEESKEEVNKAPAASGYAMTSHSGEIVQEDIYVSDASSEEEAEGDVDFLLMGSKMGLMRRGLHHPLLVQPTHQWSRKDSNHTTNTNDDTQQQQQQDPQQQEEEELAKLDPAQRAARLLAEKQRKLEEAKVLARRTESEENAGRDPCLFSKRTAFDIRFDQIDDKPWERPGSTGDVTDYFNYGLSEEDWLEYSQQQLLIRQELTDASRQRRPPDATIVPVTPRTPHKQTPKVAVANTDTTVSSETHDETSNPPDAPTDAVLGPVLVKQEPKLQQPQETKTNDAYANSAGGAWGAGAPPHLAQLIQEQEHVVDHKDEWIKQEDDTLPKPESSFSGSDYNPSGRGDGSSDWNNSHPGSQGDWNHGGTNPGDWNSQGGDWNASRRRGSYGYEDAGGRPSYRGRGGYYAGGGGGGGGGRGSYGYGGRGGRGPRQYPPPHRGRGDPYGRKRPREDYSDRTGWRR